MFNENQFSMDLWNQISIDEKFIEYKNIIIDRKSKYTVCAWKIENKEEVKKFIWNILRDKYYQKATHNSYAYRIKNQSGSILEWKNDDWETWAGMCILREMIREDCQNMIIVVTRYFWWIHLQSDRFKNVIDGSQFIINEIKKWN